MKLFTRLTFTIIAIIFLAFNSARAQSHTIAPDTTFGTGGVVFNPYNVAYRNPPVAMDVQSTGKIIQAIQSNAQILALRRYTANGLLDSTFGTNGYTVINPLGNNNGGEVTIKVLANDNILVCSGAAPTQNYVTRVTAAGAIDSTFGNSGTGYTALGAYYNITMKVLSDGSLRMILNNLINFYDTALLVKTNANGIIDSTFGTNGGVYIPYTINGTSLDPSDRIVTSVNGAVIRILTDGTIDNTFGTAGIAQVIVDTALTNHFSAPGQMPTALPDNSIAIVLNYVGGGGSIYYAAHMFANGTIDANYGNSGLGSTAFGYYDAVRGALALYNGELLIVGEETNQSSTIFDAGILNVLNTAGQPDSVFSNHTASYIFVQYDTTFGDQITEAGPVIVLPGGKIFQAGAFQGRYTWLAKYDYSGFTAGINNIAKGTDFTIYPNPSSGLCTIRPSDLSGEKYTVQMIDMTGKDVGEAWSFTGGTGTFSVSQYAKGMYMLRVINSHGEQSIRKLIVQ
jgi:uncharacterized delta-60 repeat protein